MKATKKKELCKGYYLGTLFVSKRGEIRDE